MPKNSIHQLQTETLGLSSKLCAIWWKEHETCQKDKGPFRRVDARGRALTRVDAAYLQVTYALSNVRMYSAVNYVIFSQVIALSMTSLALVESGTNILAIYCY